MGYRYYIVFASITFVYGALVWNTYNLQVAKSEEFKAKADIQTASGLDLAASRGVIYFTNRDGSKTAVAVNKSFPMIYAVPGEIEDILEASHQLSVILDVPPEKLAERFSNKKSKFELLAKKATKDQLAAIKDINLKGVYVSESSARYYPSGSMASQVIGFVGKDSSGKIDSGKYGAERQYDSKLAGVAGSVEGAKITRGQSGEDVVLTIDSNLQTEAQMILEAAIKEHRAKAGNIIIQEPKTGKILAMAAYPSFDPNNYGKYDLADFQNPAVERLYEPGSVIKIFTMAAAMDAGSVSPDTKFNDPGVLSVSGKKIYNWDKKSHGLVAMTEVIEQSLNTGTAFAQRKLGNSKFLEYFKKFGFNEKTGVDLPGEVSANMKHLSKKDAPEIAFATASFGQGISMTPLHVINAASAIANKGVLMRPYTNSASNPKEEGRVVSENAALLITDMMVSAVDKAGKAGVSGFSVAGKTGTAQVPNLERGGYYEDKVINTYVGFAPAKNPRFTALVRLVDPEGAPLAGTTVVPVFQKLASYVLNYYQVTPDRTENSNN